MAYIKSPQIFFFSFFLKKSFLLEMCKLCLDGVGLWNTLKILSHDVFFLGYVH